jgi:hypothetical protein
MTYAWTWAGDVTLIEGRMEAPSQGREWSQFQAGVKQDQRDAEDGAGLGGCRAPRQG